LGFGASVQVGASPADQNQSVSHRTLSGAEGQQENFLRANRNPIEQHVDAPRTLASIDRLVFLVLIFCE
jgi:hypothetical protein